jgi:hypothetical protein
VSANSATWISIVSNRGETILPLGRYFVNEAQLDEEVLTGALRQH